MVAGLAAGWSAGRFGGRPSPHESGATMVGRSHVTLRHESSNWKVEIRDEHGKVIKTFVGTGIPPKTVQWDGKTQTVPESSAPAR